jgi:hypothetical protein
MSMGCPYLEVHSELDYNQGDPTQQEHRKEGCHAVWKEHRFKADPYSGGRHRQDAITN